MNSYVMNYLRLLYFRDGNFNKILDTDKFSKEFSESKFTNKLDFFYDCIGYQDDNNLTPTKRRNKRKEIMENIASAEYLKSEAESNGFDRTSKLVESYQYADVLGLGQEYVSLRSNKYSFMGLSNFIEKNKELIDVFIKGASTVNTNYSTESGVVILSSLCASLCSSSYREFLKVIKQNNIDFDNMLEVRVGKDSAFRGNSLVVKKSVLDKYGKHDLIQLLVYCYTIRADIVPLRIITFFKNYLGEYHNLFTMGNKDYLYLLDICYMCGKTGNELLETIGQTIPELSLMEDKTGTIYILDFNSKSLKFIPRDTSIDRTMPCELDVDSFTSCVNRNLISQIVYKNRLPYLNNTPLFKVGEKM